MERFVTRIPQSYWPGGIDLWMGGGEGIQQSTLMFVLCYTWEEVGVPSVDVGGLRVVHQALQEEGKKYTPYQYWL